MEVARITRLPEVANNDPEFRLTARFWNTVLRLDMGDAAYLLRLTDGQMAEVMLLNEVAKRRSAWNVSITASAEEWRMLLAPLPQPFYQDLWGAVRHHGFTVRGDLESFYQYYPAIRRLFEMLRAMIHKG